MRGGFIAKRSKAVAKLPEFDDLRDQAREIKDHVLANLDVYLERFEQAVVAVRAVRFTGPPTRAPRRRLS